VQSISSSGVLMALCHCAYPSIRSVALPTQDGREAKQPSRSFSTLCG